MNANHRPVMVFNNGQFSDQDKYYEIERGFIDKILNKRKKYVTHNVEKTTYFTARFTIFES